MKKTFFCIALMLSAITYASALPVNEKITKIFKEAFPAAEQIKWIDYETYNMVCFADNKVQCRVAYDQDGKVLFSKRYYSQDFQKDISPYILAKVQEKYGDKKIHGISEENSEQGINYDIILEDDTTWFYIHCDNSGKLHLTDKFKKA